MIYKCTIKNMHRLSKINQLSSATKIQKHTPSSLVYQNIQVSCSHNTYLQDSVLLNYIGLC